MSQLRYQLESTMQVNCSRRTITSQEIYAYEYEAGSETDF